MANFKAQTINPQFNAAWDHLVRLNNASDAGDFVNIELRNQPKVRSEAEWVDWLDSFIKVMKIGGRNGWVYMHLDDKAMPKWLSIERERLKGK